MKEHNTSRLANAGRKVKTESPEREGGRQKTNAFLAVGAVTVVMICIIAASATIMINDMEKNHVESNGEALLGLKVPSLEGTLNVDDTPPADTPSSTSTSAPTTSSTSTTTSSSTTSTSTTSTSTTTTSTSTTTSTTSTTTSTTIACGGDLEVPCSYNSENEGCDEDNVLGSEGICHTPIHVKSKPSGLSGCGSWALH